MDVSYGLDRSTNLWVHGRDILRDIFGHNSLHEVHTSACHPDVSSCSVLMAYSSKSANGLEFFKVFRYGEFGIDFCNEIFEFLHQHGVIGIDVASTSGNNGFWFGAILGFTQKIEFEKDFVLEDLKSFVGSIIEEDSSGVKNSLCSSRPAEKSCRAAESEVGFVEGRVGGQSGVLGSREKSVETLSGGTGLCRAALLLPGVTTPAGRHNARGQQGVNSILYIFLLSSRGRLNQVNPSSYAQVMAKMVKAQSPSQAYTPNVFQSQSNMLPQAFQTITPQDPSWNMDTGASSHLADNTGKHAKLPFYNSESFVDSVFEIIHSDIWTSPIPNGSLSRYKARLVANGRSQQQASSSAFLQRIIASLHSEFAMTDHEEILERAHMQNCNPCRTPVDTESKLGSDGDPVSDPPLYRSLAGALQYLIFTRPDLSYAVQQVCLYMHDPRDPHFTALKHILLYVRGTLDYGLQLHVSSTTQLSAYTDAD
ncbi:ribonuclease H-like domain-containing protein [Tanacetum coccineum]